MMNKTHTRFSKLLCNKEKSNPLRNMLFSCNESGTILPPNGFSTYRRKESIGRHPQARFYHTHI